jgi:profilin
VAAFASPDQAQANGIRLAGQKFLTIQANDRSVYGKKGVRRPPVSTRDLVI